MARLALVAPRPPIVFPEVDRDYLLNCLQRAFQAGDQCHPRLKSIKNGHAFFESHFRVQYTPKCKIEYRVACNIPLTDPLFQNGRDVTYLYCSETLPYATFTPQGYYDNNGFGIGAPI